jgi:hypothetical protein
MRCNSTTSSKKRNTESNLNLLLSSSFSILIDLLSFTYSFRHRNQEQFVRRLINAQSHFGTQMDERLESREKLIQLKTHAKKF